jgi:ABC-2 type transport system permease protein
VTATRTAPHSREEAAPAAGIPGLGALARVELRKAVDTRAGFWLLVVIGLASPAVVLLQLFFDDASAGSLPGYAATAQLPAGLLLPVLGILLVTSEWSQRTAMTTFALVPRRSRVLVAKVLAAVVLALVGTAVGFVAAVVGTALTPLLTPDDADWTLTAAQAVQVPLAQAVVVLVGAAFGMLLLSSPLAIVLYFVLPTLVTVLATTIDALSWVAEWLDLNTATAPMYEGLLDSDGWWRVAASVGLWLVAPMIGGWVRIERSEIS